MNLQDLQHYNSYGLSINENVNDTFTIKNRSGETFIVEITNPNIIVRHYNWKHNQGHCHFQGSYTNPKDMLKSIYSHGNRLMKQNKKTRIDKIFDRIEAERNGKMQSLSMER